VTATVLLEAVLGGTLLGGLYAAIAAGFSIVWGVTGIINVAHGTLVIAGAYLTWLLWKHVGIDPFLAAPVAGLCLFAAGYAAQRLLLERAARRSMFMTLVFTFGLNMVLINIGLVLFSANFRSIVVPYARESIALGDLRLSLTRLLTFAAALLMTAALWLYLDRTRPGQAIRAVAQNRRAAIVLGIDPKRLNALAFGLGAGMAGMAGALIAVLYPFAPMSGDSLTMKAFVIVMLGGLGNIRGALVAAVLLGIAENTVSAIAPGYRDAVSFVLLLAVLLFRLERLPQDPEPVAAPALRAPHLPPLAWGVLLCAAGLLLAAAPFMLGIYWLHVATVVLQLAVLAQGINLIAGYTGYPAFGNVVFYGVAAYATGAAMQPGLDLPFPLAMLCGILLCTLLALLVGPALLRLQGHTFAIATLALNQAVREFVANTDALGGGAGMSLPLTPWAPATNARAFYWLFLAACVAATLLVWQFARSRLGLACRALRDNEPKARAMGLAVDRYKLIAWTLTATITGVAGSIDAWWITFIDPSSMFDLGTAVEAFIAFLLGGPATVLGPVLGAGVMQVIATTTWSQLLTWHTGVMGLVIMAVVTLFPRGPSAALAPLLRRR